MEKTARASDTRDREASAWVYDRLALYALQSVNLPEAKAFVDTSRTFKFDFSPALLTRGRLLLALGRPAKALDALREAATLNPLPEYHWILHDTLDVLGHRHEARTLHAQLMRNGAFDDPRTFSLYLSTTRQDISKALELDERELEDRADVFTLDSYAWALQVSGRRHEAREFSDRALARETRDARLFYHAEIIAGGLGNLESAESFLRKATHLEHMLFPSEQEQLAAAICQLANSERTEGGT
jgi:tetratricopeptide (TPR) repeat protein